MVRRLRALALAEYPGSGRGAYMVAHNYLQFKFQGILAPKAVYT